MSHQEKQRIFDEYAKSQGYSDWQAIQFQYCTLLMTDDEFNLFMFEACDLVQAEQQKRIAEKARIQQESCGDSMTCGCMGRCDYPVSYINKKSIINPENKIQ